MIKQYLKVKRVSAKGRGVFSQRKIPSGTLIEESPVVVLSAEDRKLIDKTLLHDYIFEWENPESDKTEKRCCMALGLIPMYNHSYQSNCEYYMDFEEEIIQIKTVRDIEKFEELTINYNGDWNDEKKVWFEVEGS